MIDRRHPWNTNLRPLIWGWCISILLILSTYAATRSKTALLILTAIQALVQLILFLHLGVETKPRWSVMTFLFMILVLVIIVAGSMWIMSNLNYNVCQQSMM